MRSGWPGPEAGLPCLTTTLAPMVVVVVVVVTGIKVRSPLNH
jgi:hypothetical protein